MRNGRSNASTTQCGSNLTRCASGCLIRLRESVGVELAGVFELVRKTRNEAGHPTGRSIEREEAEALLLLFPAHAKTVYALIEWLATQQL
jgi:hypothetical protein